MLAGIKVEMQRQKILATDAGTMRELLDSSDNALYTLNTPYQGVWVNTANI